MVEDVELDEDAGVLVAHVRVRKGLQGRCGQCGQRSAWYDRGEGRRRWRALDVGVIRAFVEADAPRVDCSAHGPTVASVPWARHGAGHTYAFDDQVAWLATVTSKSAVTELMRVAWRTVGSIVSRVWADTGGAVDRLAGVTRIGIDEISYRRGQKYLTVVVDHCSGKLLFAAPGNTMATLRGFFDLLGPDRCAQITHVSADGADWIAKVIDERIPHAVVCADPFHVVQWATRALDEVRVQSWRDARARAKATEPKLSRGRPKAGTSPRAISKQARAIRQSRYALWKNPEDLTVHQRTKLDWIAKTDPRLHRAYLLKEGLRTVFAMPHAQAVEALDVWLGWARRSRIPAFVTLARSIAAHRDRILNAIAHRLSNALIESVNTKIRLITRIAFGFKNVNALIALAMLNLGGHRPALPGR